MPLYVFWLRKGPSIKYVLNLWGDGGVIQNAYSCVQGEGVLDMLGVLYLRTYTTSYSYFGSIFVLQCLVLFVEI